MSAPYLLYTLLLSSLSLPFLLLSRQIDEVFIRCGVYTLTVVCIIGLHLSRSISDYFCRYSVLDSDLVVRIATRSDATNAKVGQLGFGRYTGG